jgi:hypothetical protein
VTRSIAVLTGLVLFSPPAAAQTRIGISAGANATSSLVRDSIVEPFTVRANPAPTLGFWLETMLDPRYSLGIGLTTSWGRLARHQASGTVDVVPLSTWTPTVRLQHTVYRGIQAFAKAGAVIYRADRTRSNLFRDGAPPAPIFGLGVRGERAIASGLRLVLDLDYDAHRFSTPAMRAEGFRGEQLVHRVGLSVGVSRGL